MSREITTKQIEEELQRAKDYAYRYGDNILWLDFNPYVVTYVIEELKRLKGKKLGEDDELA